MPNCGRGAGNRCFSIKIIQSGRGRSRGAARLAVAACPHIVELLHGLLDNLWVIGQDARLEVTLIAALHADARPREVGAADVHLLAVKDQHLEVHPGTQHPLPTPRS